ncbi:ABC transporter ATP-binding protein [Clostridiales bacterium FE2011]|nr:ABC transporter ATP-binding protein [Clostridiales bacterium FE2011]
MWMTLVTKSLIDGATSHDSSLLWKYGVLLVVIIVTERLISVFGSWIRTRTSARLQLEMQRQVTASLMSKEYPALKPFHSGELVSRVFSDVGVVKDGVLNLLPSVLRVVVSFFGAAGILITMDWRFVPVIIIVGILGVVVTALFKNPMKRRHKRMQDAQAKLHASTQETLENVRLIKASVSEERALDTMDEHREHLAKEQIRNGKLSIAMNNGLGSLFDLSWLVCNLWGCVKIYQGTFTYGGLAALIQLVGRIQGPISSAVSLISQMYGVVASAERLQEVIGLPDEVVGEKLEKFDEIRLEGVHFQYAENKEDVLVDVDGVIKKGDFVALTGISGGGKTSLFQLLLGIYKPTAGNVLFVSGDKKVPACKGTRSLFAYVPQGNMLMSGTLMENLTMFTDSADEEAIHAAVHAACLDDLVEKIGMEARLGERGIGLSEGQAQRVAIARALLSNAPILLLDEATSALDEETEAQVLRNIDAMRNKTVIIVTHRRAALGICDRVFHLEDGKLTQVQ